MDQFFGGRSLALMFECLSSVILDNPLLEPVLLDKEIEPQQQGENRQVMETSLSGAIPHHIQNSVVAAINISMFTDVEHYKEHIDSLIDGLKALPKAEGFSEIFVPGEPENRIFEDRSRNGIPLPGGTVRNLRMVAERLDIEVPYGL
ncbi:Ldh family oxidoreductase [Chloroflexota bacterium]